MIQPTEEAPVPGLDPVAARRWLGRDRTASPWLHEEVARRMIERLQWFRDRPSRWMHWEPELGGLQAHEALLNRFPDAAVEIWTSDGRAPTSLRPPAQGLWARLPWRRSADRVSMASPESAVSMLWANMGLHLEPRPRTLIQQWHRHVVTGGFVMFSCLGPDSLKELRAVYRREGWPEPAHPFTDMHDWGDMLVHSGFAEPVMDVERIVLTYSSAVAMVEELRQWGRNLSSDRLGGLRTPAWRERLLNAIEQHGERTDDGRLLLTFEVIYGHAFKAERRPSAGDQAISMNEMRAMLRTRQR